MKGKKYTITLKTETAQKHYESIEGRNDKSDFMTRATDNQSKIDTGKVILIEKSEREKGIVFTEAQIEYLNKYYIRKEGV